MKSVKNVSSLIGNTPIIELNEYSKRHQLNNTIIGKLEAFNPSGSIKDRTALAMLEDAIDKGLLNSKTTIIEPTSGNTGIGLAMLASSMGNPLILTMPESMSLERKQMLQAYGAKIVLTASDKGMQGSIDKAHELLKTVENSYMPSQFTNPANAEVHYKTTGPELWQQCNNDIDIVVIGVGTGGTITGVGNYLKSVNPSVEIIAVEPESSPVLSKGYSGSHKIQGIGAGFVPEVLDTKVYSRIICVSDDDAINTTKELLQMDGLAVGISSGAALFAASKIASETSDKRIAVIFPDSANRYFSILTKE